MEGPLGLTLSPLEVEAVSASMTCDIDTCTYLTYGLCRQSYVTTSQTSPSAIVSRPPIMEPCTGPGKKTMSIRLLFTVSLHDILLVGGIARPSPRCQSGCENHFGHLGRSLTSYSPAPSGGNIATKMECPHQRPFACIASIQDWSTASRCPSRHSAAGPASKSASLTVSTVVLLFPVGCVVLCITRAIAKSHSPLSLSLPPGRHQKAKGDMLPQHWLLFGTCILSNHWATS